MKRSWSISPNVQGLLALVAVILSGIAISVVLVDSDGDGKPDQVEVQVNAKSGDGHPTDTIEVPQAVIDQAKPHIEDDLKSPPENAPSPTAADLAHAEEVAQESKPLPVGGAVQGFDGCVTRILPVNFSSRNGARPVWQVLHYTVSFNRVGWDDVNAIVALFSNSARQASSNFVIDAEGHCAYIVPIEAKAWTQAGGNPWSISYEIVAFGNEGVYLPPLGLAKLRHVMEQVAHRTGIPMRRGSVAGSCTPGSSGIVHHKDFGLCGGGHVDITPFSIDGVIRQVVADAPVLTAKSLKLVRSARHPAGTGHSRTYWRHRIRLQIAWLVDSPNQPRRDRRLSILRRVLRETA